MTENRKTVGQQALDCARDSTKYDSIDVGIEINRDILEHLGLCIQKHNSIIDEDEYCVCFLLASDCLIKGVTRRKFYASVHLPKPRPEQTVFLYSKSQQRIVKRLWSLPDAEIMAKLSESKEIPVQVQNWKLWSDAFFHGWQYDKANEAMINTTPSHFFNVIRKQHGISMLSEREFMELHRTELVKSCGDGVESIAPDTFDFTKVMNHKVIYPEKTGVNKNALDHLGKTQTFNRNISSHDAESVSVVN